MSRLIVLSNRVKMPDNGPTAGGLAVALDDVLVGSSVIWMGWNGEVIDTDNDFVTNQFNHSKLKTTASADTKKPPTEITYMTTALTTEQYRHYYCGFANSVLWLLLHERPDLISQAVGDYAGYQAINRLFAEQLKKMIEPDDVIWVHDYHFLSVAYHCRELGLNNRIGFFLHIPFAPLPFWQALNQSAELIEHLAHYDVLGTQTLHDKANCLAVFQHYLKDKFLDKSLSTSCHSLDSSKSALYKKQSFAHSQSSAGVQLRLNLKLRAAHYLLIKAYPIGVNVDRIQQQVSHLSYAKHSQPDVIKSAAQQIIAVDRIDYSKGLLERFLAYRDFLQHYPEYQNQLKLLQIACPSRLDLPVYQRLYDEVRQVVTKINQQFLSSGCADKCTHGCQTDAFEFNSVETDVAETSTLPNPWQAITYSEKVLCHERLMRAFWHSDVGWVNSLKDGMNLVAKEYIAAQNPDNPGVLLLSCYAGAAEQMHAALIINPHQPNSMIKGVKTALTMPLAERKSRHQTLLQGLQQDNLSVWQQNFLDDLYDGKRRHAKSSHSAAIHMLDPQE